MPPPPPPPPELPDELLGEIFLRLPPDDPACLLRASLACKRWRRVLADPVFRSRHRELHRTPSVVGFLRVTEEDAPYASRFIPNNPASSRPAARDLPGWHALDCRHGHALFLTLSSEPLPGSRLVPHDFILWDPMTNERRRLPRPSPPPANYGPYVNAAVLCAAATDGCDHRNCHGGPFLVAFAWSRYSGNIHPSYVTYARVYSSETGNWSEPISVQHPYAFLDKMPSPSILVGDTVYFQFGYEHALEYQLGAQRLSIIDGPPQSMPLAALSCWKLMSMEDGGLGCMDVEEVQSSLRLQVWSREASSGSEGVAQWTRGKAIDLEKLLPDDAFPSPRLASVRHSRLLNVQVQGFAEGTDVVFVGSWSQLPIYRSGAVVYMVHLNSGSARMVFDQCSVVIPYTSFCIPVTDASSTTEGPGDGVSRA